MKSKLVWACMLLLSAAFLCSCGGRKAPEENPFRMEQALTQSYENILFYPFETNEEIQKYYPKAREESLHAVIRHLRDKKKYRKIDKVSGNFDKKSTLLVKVHISEMRIVGGVARAFGLPTGTPRTWTCPTTRCPEGPTGAGSSRRPRSSPPPSGPCSTWAGAWPGPTCRPRSCSSSSTS